MTRLSQVDGGRKDKDKDKEDGGAAAVVQIFGRRETERITNYETAEENAFQISAAA